MIATIGLNYDPKELARELKLRERTAALIVALRTESGLTYEEIEAKAGITKEELMSWESGSKSPRSLDVARLADHCGTDATVSFQVGFSRLLRESQTRIAELQGSTPLCVRQENFSAPGAAGGTQMPA